GDDGIDGAGSAAHGFGKALALVRTHAGDINRDTAESCVHVVHIIHCPYKFTSCYCHEGSLSSDPRKVGAGRVPILDAGRNLVKAHRHVLSFYASGLQLASLLRRWLRGLVWLRWLRAGNGIISGCDEGDFGQMRDLTA